MRLNLQQGLSTANVALSKCRQHSVCRADLGPDDIWYGQGEVHKKEQDVRLHHLSVADTRAQSSQAVKAGAVRMKLNSHP